jgi:hypothetical protein
MFQITLLGHECDALGSLGATDHDELGVSLLVIGHLTDSQTILPAHSTVCWARRVDPQGVNPASNGNSRL